MVLSGLSLFVEFDQQCLCLADLSAQVRDRSVSLRVLLSILDVSLSVSGLENFADLSNPFLYFTNLGVVLRGGLLP